MIKHLLSIFVFISFVATLHGQTKEIDKLKNEQKKSLQRLEMTSKLLEENKQSTSSTLTKLNLLNEQIETRQLLISQINEELRLIKTDMNRLQEEINAQQQQLQTLKQEYAELMYRTYLRSNSHDKLMFVLSAKSLSQSYRRLRYLQEFSSYRKAQAKEIEVLTVSLNSKLEDLEKQKKAQESVLKQRESESRQLAQEKSSQQGLINDLKKKEKDLTAQLKAQQKQMDDLNDKITKMIAKENTRATGKGGTPATKGGMPLTKEEQLIAGNFEKNKGKLPWPVERGIITGKFGTQPHPVLPHVTVNNKGIYIQTDKNADARAVFEGEVSQRFSVAGNNNAVIIRHGNYRTVYSNLTEIYVKEGDKVTAKQKIGKVYSDPEEDYKTVLYFMVWLEKELQNPELYLAK